MTNNMAVFGGTFDPIHNGHLYIIRFILEELNFNQVMLIPNKIPPHKTTTTDHEHRLAMVNLAIGEVNVDNKIKINTSELSRTGKSYTIDTLQELKLHPSYADKNFWLVLGLDAFYSLPTWYNWPGLQQNTNFIVIDRNIEQSNLTSAPSWVKSYLQEKQIFKIADDDLISLGKSNGHVFMPQLDPIDISASKIRLILKQYYQSYPDKNPDLLESLNYLLPEKVLAYILAEELYI